MSTVSPQRPPMPRQPQPPRPAATPSRFTATVDPIRVLRRYMLLIIASIFVGGVLGVGLFFYLDTRHPQYTGEVFFEIRAGLRESHALSPGEMGDDLTFRLANTETLMLTSRQVLSAALQRVDVDRTRWYQSFVLRDEHGMDIPDIESMVDDLEETVSATVVRGTNFFRLRWQAAHSADVPIVLNSIADAYIDRRRTSDREVWDRTLDVFTRQRNATSEELALLERNISQFIIDHGIVSLTDPQNSQVASSAEQLTRHINDLTSAVSMTQTSRQQTEAKLAGEVEPTAEDKQEARQHRSVQQLEQQIVELRAELRHQGNRLHESHNVMRVLRGRLEALELERDHRIHEVIQENLAGREKRLLSDLERFRTRMEQAQEELDEVDGRLRELTAKYAEYRALQSERDRMESQLQADLEVITQIRLLQTREDAARVRVAQRAERPRSKSFPRMSIVIPLTTLVTLMLTLGLIFLRELTDQRIKGAGDLAVLSPGLGGRVLGVIPELAEDPTGSKQAELVVRKHPNSVLAESYRQACALMMRSVERNGHQTILFLSGLPGAGTTTAVTNVAASLAAAGQKVLVVDANFRRPRLMKALGIDDAEEAGSVGLGDLLVGAAAVEETIIRTEYGVDVIGAGTPGNRVFERLHNGLFESVIAEMRGKYDLILFDAPPAVVAGDAMVLANRLDAAVLVVRANQEQRGLVARLLGQLADARCEHLGVLLNRPRGTAGGYFKKNFETMAKYAK